MGKLKSVKLWFAFIICLVTWVQGFCGIISGEQQQNTIVGVFSLYCVGNVGTKFVSKDKK